MKTGISEPREVTKIVTAHRQREGGGFIVRRPFPSAGLRHADPFLLLDEMGPVEYGRGEAIGAPDHPHRGFETASAYCPVYGDEPRLRRCRAERRTEAISTPVPLICKIR